MAADNKDEGDKLVAAPDFRGPRGSTSTAPNVLFLILLFCGHGRLTGIGIHAVTSGDYRLVVYPLD
jgi:hypothetical protein